VVTYKPALKTGIWKRMNEQKIIAALLLVENWERVEQYLDNKDFSTDGALIIDEIREYYKTDPQAKAVDKEILNARIERRVPNAKAAKSLQGLIESLPDVSGANVVQEVLDLKANAIGLELAVAIGEGKNRETVGKLLSRYQDALNAEEDTSSEITNLSVKDLLENHFDDSKLIQIAPKSLNDRIDGGARPGHHVLVFAPTEMGKTLFVINMVAHFLRQRHSVLYVGNEDPAADIIYRIISRLSGLDKYAVRADPERAQRACDEANYSLLTFADLAPGDFTRIRSLVKRYRPSVVILDQLSNINVTVSRNESKTGSLEQAAKEARGLAKRSQLLVVSVVQAADSATGKVVLGRGDVHNSNVGIPGQVDLMLGLGADEAMESRGLREISIVKNKISGNHDHFTVKIIPHISKVEA
jgi:archaellum biogenesis ATPase FlaH